MNKTILLNSIVGISSQVKLQTGSIDLDQLIASAGENGRVNLFNLEEPLHGDIVGFNIQLNDCDDGASGTVTQIGDGTTMPTGASGTTNVETEGQEQTGESEGTVVEETGESEGTVVEETGESEGTVVEETGGSEETPAEGEGAT